MERSAVEINSALYGALHCTHSCCHTKEIYQSDRIEGIVFKVDQTFYYLSISVLEPETKSHISLNRKVRHCKCVSTAKDGYTLCGVIDIIVPCYTFIRNAGNEL